MNELRFMRIAGRDFNLNKVISIDIDNNALNTPGVSVCTVEYEDNVSITIPIKGTKEQNLEELGYAYRRFFDGVHFVDTGIERR